MRLEINKFELNKFKLDKVIEWQDKISNCSKNLEKLRIEASLKNIDRINESLRKD